ncbi:nucleolar pre-ribosomal-associated protein 1 isoform X1 [Peromyscus maniculatus bairdii]|uniref:nucleolar pre-ribosomal-associated protein 1 isoform X1 n=2 Tax=Peromyscus maniculatus bairdii TaxID=230844 RepID=UPI00042AC34A|nr:nucleolar pre-ribosomal-associated protein 1 [Peromyscus maniculatus bairdii]
MGVPKRKASESPGGAAPPAGTAKRTRAEELTGVRFKTQLRDAQGPGPALEAFVSAAKQLPHEGMCDVVEGYIKISMECAEIFQLLSGEKRPESEMLLIFQVFEAILLRTASDLAHFHVVGINIVKKLLNNHMKLLCESLYASGYRLARACLDLMAAMVTQGPEAARDVCSCFDLNKKALYTLVTKRGSKGVHDVRLAYIQFALSFLIAGDDNTIGQVLELKEFIPCIFSSGIKEDKISTINILLSTLKTKVIHNKNITKTQKVRFFTGQLLNHIASLYNWNGITDVSPENPESAEVSAEEAGKAMVRDLVHNFLIDLCCSRKHGICFYDASLGTSGRGGNLTLLHFLLSLKTAAGDELVAALVVNILKVCPDLLTKYFKEVTFSFLPRVKSAWLNNVKLLNKIYEAQPEISQAFWTREFIPLPRLLAMVMVTTVPLVCNKIMFTQALNLDSIPVRHSALALISVILKRALKTVEHCLDKEVWQDSGVYTAEMMEDFVQLFREALSKNLPDLNTVIWVWQSLKKQEIKQDHGKGKKSASKTPAASEPVQRDDAETILLKAVLLQVICLYQQVVPHMVMQYNFDFSKLLKGIISEQGPPEEVPPILQHHMLKVALELPANKFLWLKAQEGHDAEIIGGERSVFYLLMKMFVSSNHLQLKASTKLLIMKILRDTGVFEHTWRELELWLEHLDSTAEEHKETIIQFLERILLTLVVSPYSYTDKAAEFVQEASTLQASVGKQDADDVSIPISHIDDVLDMVDVLVEGSEGLDEEIGFLLNEDMILLTFPFSALVPAALEARNKLLLGTESKAGESVLAYLIAVLTDLLHTQRDPLALCLLLQAYDKCEPASLLCRQQLAQFHRYYSLWIPEHAQEVLPLQVPSSSVPHVSTSSCFSTLLQTAYESRTLGDKNIQTQLLAAVPGLALQQVLRSAKQVLLYLRSTVENFSRLGKSVGPTHLQLLLDLLKHLVVHSEQLDAQNQQKAEAARAESDLFLDMESVASLELATNKTGEELLVAVLKHPTLESWFLALEQKALPPHTLSPILVKLLAAHFSAGVLQLLVASSPILHKRGRLDLLAKYSEAITQSVLRELRTRTVNSATAPKTLLQLEALRELHPYMESVQIREVTLALLGLPKAHLLAPQGTQSPGEERQLSRLGKTLVQLLASSPREQLQSSELLWWAEYVRGLGTLLPTLAEQELDTVFLQTLQRDPVLAPAVPADLLEYCLVRRTEAALGIASLLLRHSSTHLLKFELWCGQPGAGLLQEHLDAFLPLIRVYLQHRTQGCSLRPAGVRSAVTPVLRALWRRVRDRVFQIDGLSTHERHLESLAQLVPFARTKDLHVLMDHLPSLLRTPSSHRSWIVADSVSEALAGSAEELRAWRKTLLGSCLQWLAVSFSGREPGDEDPQEQEKPMLLRFSQLLHELKAVDPGDWQQFVKTGLKFRYQDLTFLKTLLGAVRLLYSPESSLHTELVQLPVVHMMLTQHSLFLPTMLTSEEQENLDSQVKETLVDLMSAVVKMCPSVCESSHFAVLLGTYSATLSVLDQKILLLLRAYEQNNLSLISFRVLLWGPAAVEHHKTCRSLGKSLWQQPSVGDILRLLDPERMMQTILHFPQDRRLLPAEDTGEPLVFTDKTVRVDLDSLYDPCFLLHLFGELTRPEFVVDCRKFLDSNALGLTVAALSSYDPQMRAAAYSVLAAYYSHLEGARFREQSQVLYLLDVVRNGIKAPNLRLPFTVALFIAKAALQILKPEEHMYWKISKFLLSHDSVNMDKLPGFYQFFYSSDFQQRTEQEWVLGILRQGIRDKQCYELCSRRGVLHIILSFFSSPLCDQVAQNWILEILQNIAHVTRPAYEVIRDYSLLTWILHILESRFVETRLLSNVISLLHTLWVTNLGNKAPEQGGQPPCQPGSHESQKMLALHMVNEFLYVLIALTKHLRPTLASAQLIHFFWTLESVLSYRATILKTFKEMGRFTVNKETLSTKDVLVLLHKWSLIERDTTLQGALKAVIEQHQVKDLMKMLKDKNKPVTAAHAKGPRGRKKRNGEVEETAEPELEASSLETCKDLLRATLTHWGPVVTIPGPTQESVGQASPGSKTLDSTHAALSLVASWVLRSLAERPLGRAEATRLLDWLKGHVLPCPAVVADLLRDSAVKSGIFRLYGRHCSAQGLAEPAQDVACEFSSVMLQLLVAQGRTDSPFHPAVEALCLDCLNEKDEAKRAPAAFLVSLYVKDVWLGAQQPDTFLHHVRMVCDAAEDGPHGEAEAIVLLCRNIDSLTQTPDSPLPASAPAGSRRLRARFPGGVN